jgi:hypothetical protein
VFGGYHGLDCIAHAERSCDIPMVTCLWETDLIFDVNESISLLESLGAYLSLWTFFWGAAGLLVPRQGAAHACEKSVTNDMTDNQNLDQSVGPMSTFWEFWGARQFVVGGGPRRST